MTTTAARRPWSAARWSARWPWPRSPGVPLGPNPRVGCVLLDDDGDEVAEGFHRGAGYAARRGRRPARGRRRRARSHRRRHPRALQPHRPHRPLRRGADRGRGTPGGLRAGGHQPGRCRGSAGPRATPGSRSRAACWPTEARALNRAWTFAVEHGRPFVTWKFATTLDGRSAAADGTSRWVSSRAARLDTHRLRALCDTMLVGTGTVAVDDPELTVRDEVDEPLPRQPLRAVMGLARPRRRAGGSSTTAPRPSTSAPATRTRRWPSCYARDRQHVFLEGGPTLAAAFLEAGLVDEIVTYVAPMLLGAGLGAVGDLGIATIADAVRLDRHRRDGARRARRRADRTSGSP